MDVPEFEYESSREYQRRTVDRLESIESAVSNLESDSKEILKTLNSLLLLGWIVAGVIAMYAIWHW